jgi:hypothetical protein
MRGGVRDKEPRRRGLTMREPAAGSTSPTAGRDPDGPPVSAPAIRSRWLPALRRAPSSRASIDAHDMATVNGARIGAPRPRSFEVARPPTSWSDAPPVQEAYRTSPTPRRGPRRRRSPATAASSLAPNSTPPSLWGEGRGEGNRWAPASLLPSPRGERENQRAATGWGVGCSAGPRRRTVLLSAAGPGSSPRACAAMAARPDPGRPARCRPRWRWSGHHLALGAQDAVAVVVAL